LEVLKPIFEHAEDNEGDTRLIDQDYSLEAGTALDELFPEQGGLE
jgi:hypothetical protein